MSLCFHTLTSGKFYYYSFTIFPHFWLVKTTCIIHHNQLLLTKYWTNDVKSAARCKLLNWWHQNDVKSEAHCSHPKTQTADCSPCRPCRLCRPSTFFFILVFALLTRICFDSGHPPDVLVLVIHLGLRPLWITPSSICRILHILLSLIQWLLNINRGDFLLKIRGCPWGGPWTPVHVLYSSQSGGLSHDSKIYDRQDLSLLLSTYIQGNGSLRVCIKGFNNFSNLRFGCFNGKQHEGYLLHLSNRKHARIWEFHKYQRSPSLWRIIFFFVTDVKSHVFFVLSHISAEQLGNCLHFHNKQFKLRFVPASSSRSLP